MSGAETDKLGDLAVAVRTAKSFVGEAFAGESIENLGLEEVIPPEGDDVWQVTLGFDRRRSRPPSPFESVRVPNAFMQAAAEAAARPQRVYKVIKVDVTVPRALSMVNRKED